MSWISSQNSNLQAKNVLVSDSLTVDGTTITSLITDNNASASITFDSNGDGTLRIQADEGMFIMSTEEDINIKNNSVSGNVRIGANASGTVNVTVEAPKSCILQQFENQLISITPCNITLDGGTNNLVLSELIAENLVSMSNFSISMLDASYSTDPTLLIDVIIPGMRIDVYNMDSSSVFRPSISVPGVDFGFAGSGTAYAQGAGSIVSYFFTETTVGVGKYTLGN